jgi:peptide deformylase
MSTDPNILEINVDDSIKTGDVPPGTPAPTMKQIEENLPQEEVEKRQKIMLEYTRLLSRYCEPHNKKSRWVTQADIPAVLADGKDLVAMCNLPRGKYSSIGALAHPQIEANDPLRFFVLPNGMVVINPVITSNTKVPVMKKEACMSFPDNDPILELPRYNKITVSYQTLAVVEGNTEPILSKIITETLNGGVSHVYQHECGHLNGCNIYDTDYSPEKSIGLGDGLAIDMAMWGEDEIPKEDLPAVLSNTN